MSTIENTLPVGGVWSISVQYSKEKVCRLESLFLTIHIMHAKLNP